VATVGQLKQADYGAEWARPGKTGQDLISHRIDGGLN
jgi:hypothetical protein